MNYSDFLHFPFSKYTLGICVEQSPANQHQISETEQRKQLDGIFSQPFVARLVITKQVLHHMEWMLNLGANSGLGMSSSSPSVVLGNDLRFPGRIATCHVRGCCANDGMNEPWLGISTQVRFHAEMSLVIFLGWVSMYAGECLLQHQ